MGHGSRGLLLAFALGASACRSAQKEPQTAAAAAEEATAAPVPPAESGYADVNGLRMYYEVHGSGQPIVLVHGSFMNIPMNWAHVIPTLSQSRKVIVAEMQGHGRTRDVSRELSYEGMADDVSGLLDHLSISSADVLGYSMGAGVAYQVAIRHPERVRRLVILSGAYAHDGWWPDAEASFGTITADMFKGSPIEKQYVELGNDPAHFAEFIRKVIGIDLKPYDWTAEAKAITAPLFIVLGDVDGVRYEHALELFRAKGGGKMGDIHGLPKSRLAIIPGTTHVGMLQRVNWWLPMLNDFLDSDLAPTPPTF
jgi:pimeloyl-ACP methyl ester carboxylesterase